ncbi:MAG: DUF488 family protein [Nanoarchaeota archaeon]|nr:DUF488 family protein [Nanoarchaeota archaeon]
MIRTKSILKEISGEDGLRVSVMSMHTLSDGVTPDLRITEKSYDLWNKQLAPPKKLIGAFYRGEISWSEYENKYLTYLKSVFEEVRTLASEGLEKNITLLCIEENANFCHRRLLAEECKRYKPSLELSIN